MTTISANQIGFYDRPDQPVEQPTYDPPHDAPCPYCGGAITAVDVRTHSIMYAGGAARSYFYRTHRTCAVAASEAESQVLDGMAFEAVEALAPPATDEGGTDGE